MLNFKDLFKLHLALNHVLKEFDDGKKVIFIAPTGYGKTMLSLELIRVAQDNLLSWGLIHVAPYRALVREIFNQKFKGKYPDVGYQSHDEIGVEGKSPYFLRDLVVTTLDSFVYNLFKIPVTEMNKIISGKWTLGHFYAVLASINTSTIVFDEAHMYLSDVGGLESESLALLLASLDYLIAMENPLVIETATLNTKVITYIAEFLTKTGGKVSIVYVGEEDNPQFKKLKELRSKGISLRAVVDDRFIKENSIEWETKFIRPEDIVTEVKQLCHSEPILIIRNTVKNAIETFLKLREVCDKVVLIHGLLSNKDRENALKQLKIIEDSSGVIVATQVIEAGIDINSRILITDPAPIENLVQRVGRLCRKGSKIFSKCIEEGAQIYIIEGDVSELAPIYSEERVIKTINHIKEIKKLEWRLLDDRDGFKSFTNIIEEIPPQTDLSQVPQVITYELMRRYLSSDVRSDVLMEIIKRYNLEGLVRSSILVNVLIPPLPNSIKGLNELEYVSVDLNRLILRERDVKAHDRCLEYEDDYAKLIIVTHDEGKLTLSIDLTKKKLNEVRGRFNLVSALEYLSPKNKFSTSYGVFLLASERCYERGLGLKI
jgi:CRISPR-associated endonuclease/helicase Cas3